MREDYSPMNEEENLRTENEFLKLKLMLEHGGQFGEMEEDSNTELPPEIENQFLNNVLAFEKQFSEHKVIKVYDKIGRPQHLFPDGQPISYMMSFIQIRSMTIQGWLKTTYLMMYSERMISFMRLIILEKVFFSTMFSTATSNCTVNG
jgi:hypothetical protein